MSTTRPVYLFDVAEGIFSSQTIDIWSDANVNGKTLKVVMFNNFIFKKVVSSCLNSGIKRTSS